MSNIVSSACQKRVFGSSAKKSVIMYMADRASDDGSGIWASKGTIAEDTELGVRTVQLKIKELISDGIIFEVGQRPCENGFTYVYQINLDAVKSLPDTGSKTPKSTPAADAPPQQMHPTPAADAPHPRDSCGGTPATAAYKPSLNHPGTIQEPSSAHTREVSGDLFGKTPSKKSWKGDLHEGCSSIDGEFERVWPHYREIRICPKKPALKAWKTARRKATFEEIAKPLAAYIEGKKGKNPEFTKHLATWLNQECWTEEPAALLSGKESPQDRKARLLAGQAQPGQIKREVPLQIEFGGQQ